MLKKRRIALIISLLVSLSVVSGCSQNTANNSNSTNTNSQIDLDEENKENIEDQNVEGNETIEDNQEDEIVEEIEEDKSEQGEVVVGSEVYISANPIVFREGNDKTTAKLGSILKGTPLTIESIETNESGEIWYKVTHDGKTGFVSAEFTVQDRTELLTTTFTDLDFQPRDKQIYEDNKPVKVKGIYLTKYSTSGKKIDQLISMAKSSGINTFVIDVKDDRGEMLFYSQAAAIHAPEANDTIIIKDISAFIQKLKDNGIYTIARIVSFKDPIYSNDNLDRCIIYKDTKEVYKSGDGLAWASAYDRNLWEYNVDVAKEAAEAGFNEIQFDYVRFPASGGGKLDEIVDYRNEKNESKPKAIQEYLKYAYDELSPYHVYIGADVYGLVGSVQDDMSLGQYWEAISNVVDYICPMMYPSHYAEYTYGVAVPDADPYDLLLYGARDAVLRNDNIKTPATIRPWIQDFTASWVKGYIQYGETEVKAQINALEENGIDEFMLWNASNKYHSGAVD
ncbi:putative glycoside hydrolase [Clostridium sp. DL1XJH146]